MTLFGKYLKGDQILWWTVIGLMILSLPVVFSASSTLAYKSSNMLNPFLKHMGLLFFGLISVFVVHRFPYKYLSGLSVLLYSVAVVLLILTIVFGQNLNSATRSLPIFGISFQTSDFAKLVLVLYAARVLSKNKDELNDYKKVLLPLISRILIICGLILPSDLSTAGLLFFTILVIMYIAGVKWYNLALISIAIVILLSFAMYLLRDYVPRIDTWVSRVEQFAGSDDQQVNDDKSFQEVQAKIAIATGGPFGKGPGHSTQRNVLPHPYSDFAYAMIVEEYGIIGAFVVLLAYIWLLYRSSLIHRRSPTLFGSLIAIGLGLGLFFQAFINMGVCVGLLPVTGQPLPFISMGGTSVFFSGVAVGIILNVSSNQNETITEVA